MAVLIVRAINAVRKQAAFHLRGCQTAVGRVPGDNVAVVGRSQNHILAHLIGAAPDEQFGLSSIIDIREGKDPDGVIAITTTQNVHNCCQPVMVIDPGRGAGRVQFNVAFWYIAVPHSGREQIVSPPRRRTAQLAGPAAQAMEMLPGHSFHHPGKPHQAAAAGDVLAHVPVGQAVQVADGFGIVQAVENAG